MKAILYDTLEEARGASRQEAINKGLGPVTRYVWAVVETKAGKHALMVNDDLDEADEEGTVTQRQPPVLVKYDEDGKKAKPDKRVVKSVVRVTADDFPTGE